MPDSLGLNVIVHRVLEPGQWPRELLETTVLLSQSTLEPHQIDLSPDAVGTCEVTTRLLFAYQDDGENKRVNDILGIVLETVQILRSYTKTGLEYLGRPALCIWVSLLSTLAFACSKDAILMTDAPFLLPKTMKVDDEAGRTIFEGRATILISAYIAPKCFQDEETESIDEANGRESGASEDLSLTRFLPLDGPFDGHILPGPGNRIDCVLPVICTANQDNIYSLVTSAVCQRYTWGISLSVVGIMIEDTGTIATVVIGWINEGKETGSSELPQVHLASASGEAADSALGIFDLSDPVSALQFANFILGLRHQFSDIVADFGSKRRDVCWRMDHLCASGSRDFHSSVSLDWPGRIERWLEEIDSWDRGPVDILKLSEESQQHFNEVISRIASRVPLDIRTKNHKTPASEGSTEPSSPDYYTASAFAALRDSIRVRIPDASTFAFESTHHAPSHYSASAFAKLEATLINRKLGMEQWLFERRSIRVAFCRIDKLLNQAEIHFNNMIDSLTCALELAWPDQWHAKMINDDLTDISYDVLHRDILHLLFDQYRVYLTEHTHPTSALVDDEFGSLTTRLPMFLSVVSHARHRAQQASEVLAKSQMREVFDLLLNLFWCNKEATISDSYFQNQWIQLAKNQAVDGTIHEVEQIYLCEDIVYKQWSSELLSSTISRALGERLLVLGKKKFSSRFKPGPKPVAADRASEPTHGVADGLAITRVLIDSHCGSAATEILLPRLIVKYQEPNSRHTTNALRQCQMACISAVEFLFSLGIAASPVYGFVVCGSRVSIMMAWHCTQPMRLDMDSGTHAAGFNVLLDDNLVSLDIAEPLDAYHFAIVIHRIFLAGRQLVDLLKGKDLSAIREFENLFFSPDFTLQAQAQ